jgi:hypothetical protein
MAEQDHTIGKHAAAELADLLRDAIEAANIGQHIRFEDLHDEVAGTVLLECIGKLQEPELAMDLVRRASAE